MEQHSEDAEECRILKKHLWRTVGEMQRAEGVVVRLIAYYLEVSSGGESRRRETAAIAVNDASKDSCGYNGLTQEYRGTLRCGSSSAGYIAGRGSIGHVTVADGAARRIGYDLTLKFRVVARTTPHSCSRPSETI